MEAGVQALTANNFSGCYVAIYTDESVVRRGRNAWVLRLRKTVMEDSGALLRPQEAWL